MTLAEDVAAFLRRFVVMDDDKLLVAALWVVHTHAYQAVPQTPYLSITSPERQCGKSTLLELLELLVARPWSCILPSEAVAFRKVSQSFPTLLLDEVDAIFNDKSGDRYEGLRAMLNAGNRNGATVPRCAGPSHEVVDFLVYCPKAIAGIGKLPDTVADRSVPIRLERKTRADDVERFRLRKVEGEAAGLKARIEAWAAENIDALADAEPELPEALSDRQQDGTEPLIAIADLMGIGERARAAVVALCTADRADTDERAGVALLRDLKTVFDAHPDAPAGFSESLLTGLAELPESRWTVLTARGMASLLGPFGVHPQRIRIDEHQRRGYLRAELQPAWERYCGA